MAYLVTAPDVSFALIEGRAVFLDARRDRYATLPPELTEALVGVMASDSAVAPNDPLIPRLVATGLFELSPRRGGLANLTCRPPAAGVADEARPPLRPTDLAEVWGLLARSARIVRKSPIHAILGPPRVASAATSEPDHQAQTERLARRFVRARALVPMAPACLADSLAMRVWLTRRRLACQLVLAVRLEPFEAHCWIEAGGVVLNDAPERIAAFVPVGLFA